MSILSQFRSGFQKLIDADSQTFTYDVSSDSTDPYAATTSKTFKGRIAHERSFAQSPNETTAGVSTALQKFLSYPYTEGELQSGDVITDESNHKWRIEKPDELRIDGGVYGYQCSIQEV
jgi:hypothetical protein